jgi:lipoprotein-releasing system ATP-binding protein
MNREQCETVNNEKEVVLEVRNLKKVFKTGETFLTVLNDLNLRVHRGDTAAIVGRSGSGKSTLLNIIGGLDSPTLGNVILKNTCIEDAEEAELSRFRNRYIGFIFQFHHLLSEFSVAENIMIPFLLNEYDLDKAYSRSVDLMKILGIYSKRDAKPNKLSGGESQRVAIARALINKPEIILADEPTGNLDIHSAEKIKGLLFDTVRSFGHTLIIVTHNSKIVKDIDVVYELKYGRLNNLLDNSD